MICSQAVAEMYLRGMPLRAINAAFEKRGGSFVYRHLAKVGVPVSDRRTSCGHLRTSDDHFRVLLAQRSKQDPTTGCIEWSGAKTPSGYGKCRIPARLGGFKDGTGYTHRLAWILIHGPIPADLTIDHLCFNPACLNTDHMVLATQSENSARKKSCSTVPDAEGNGTKEGS